MPKINKTLLFFPLLGASLIGLTGCTSLQPGRLDIPTETKSSNLSAQEELELLNLYNDLDLFIQFNNQQIEELRALEKGTTTFQDDETANSEEDLAKLFSKSTQNEEDSLDEENSLDEEDSLDKEEIKRKSFLVMGDYIHNVYSLAASRLSSDIETVYTYSDEYMAYIAMLQSFVDMYTEQQEDFQEKIYQGDISCLEMDCFKQFETVESFYMDMMSGLEDTNK